MKWDLMRVLLIHNATEKRSREKKIPCPFMTQGTLIKMWQLLNSEKGTMEPQSICTMKENVAPV